MIAIAAVALVGTVVMLGALCVVSTSIRRTDGRPFEEAARGTVNQAVRRLLGFTVHHTNQCRGRVVKSGQTAHRASDRSRLL
jgi:hypothetical protein